MQVNTLSDFSLHVLITAHSVGMLWLELKSLGAQQETRG